MTQIMKEKKTNGPIKTQLIGFSLVLSQAVICKNLTTCQVHHELNQLVKLLQYSKLFHKNPR